MRRRLLGASVALMLVAACGSSGNEVNVTTAETSSGQVIASDRTTFTAGETYHFVVENDGQIPHEVMIVQPIEPGAMDMKAMDEMALYVVEEDDLQAGATVEFDYTFPADSVGTPLEFACHITGHYEAGMHLPITVES
ncbi:MAG TPA: hypothetical protein VI980_08745 [Acidimicrobiia bacterium]|nr:hypothetical protein [Acidimicrobiia bacterium]